MICTEDCWEWPGTRRKQDGRALACRDYAYRLVYRAATGHDCPVGMSAHHRCENPGCVNPWHLEFKPQGSHMIEHGLTGGDWGQAHKTQCPAGHDYNDENTYTYITKEGYTERQCRLCLRDKKRERRRARRAAGIPRSEVDKRQA